MTRDEIEQKLRKLREDQFYLQSVMFQSDAHASKCVKLGLNFQDTYPDDYKSYISARERYNVNEDEIAILEQTEPDPEPVPNPDPLLSV